MQDLRQKESAPPSLSKYMKKNFDPSVAAFGSSNGRGGNRFGSARKNSSEKSPPGKKYTKKQRRDRKRQQDRYSQKLHDPYNTMAGGTKQMPKFKCSDGAQMPYQVIGHADAELKHICFVVVQDLFDTYEKIHILFRAIAAKHMGVQILVFNYPGQAHTTLPSRKDTVLNNEYNAARLHELLQGLENEGEFYTRTRPFHLLGFGSGASTASYFASMYGNSPEYNRSLRSLVAINGYSYVDNQLAAIMHSAINVFSCFPPDRPDLPVSYFSRFLFSEDYLSRVDKNMALNLYTAVMNPITLDGRLRLLRGVLHHIDLRGSGVKGIAVPIVVVQSTENALVSSSHVDALVEGRTVSHVWAHQQSNLSKLSTSSKHMLHRTVGPPSRDGSGGTDSALVLWLKSGHAVAQEQKQQLLDLLETLATSDDALNDAAIAAQKKLAAEEKQRRRKQDEEARKAQKALEEKLRKETNVYIQGSMPESIPGNAEVVASTYEQELAEYKRSADVDRLMGIDSFTSKVTDEEVEKQSVHDFEGGTGAKGTDLAGELQARIEQRLLDFDAEQQKKREEDERAVQEDLERLKQEQIKRRKQWEDDDKDKMIALQNELHIRKLERDKEELMREKRLGLIKASATRNAATPSSAEDAGTVVAGEGKEMKKVQGEPTGHGTVLTRSSVYAVPVEVDENAPALSGDLFGDQEAELERAEAERQAEMERRIKEREDQIAQYNKTQQEMKEAEEARQREIAERKAAKLAAQQLAASIVIQALGRRILAKVIVAERMDAKEMEEVYAIACLRVQATMRMVLAKARTRNIRRQRERTRASYTIAGELQRFYRGWCGRADAQDRREERSVRLIQRIARGMLGREIAKKEAVRQAALQEEQKAAKKIQALFRMHKGMLVYQQRFVEDLGATAIQKCYRGVLGRRKAMRKRRWQKAEPGPERLQLGLQLIEDSKEEFEKHRQEIEQLHRAQEKAEQKVSLIHAGLKESEKELAILERELREIDQLDRDLKELTHERELYETSKLKSGDMNRKKKASNTALLSEEGEAEAKKGAAETYALEMAIHLKRAERERKKKELEAEFSGVFAEVTQKREQLGKLESKISEMEMNRQRKDREFQRLQRKLMELLEEQKLELDNLRAKGVELEVATATSAAAAAATAASAKKHEEKTKAIFSGTEELLKFQFMSMSLGYFNSLNMLKSLKDMNADTTASAIKSSADTAAAAAAAAAAANIPSMKHLGIGADELVSAMSQKRLMNAEAKKKEIEDAKRAMEESFPDDVHVWKVRDVVRWLDLQMLGQYKKAFAEAAVDGDFLMELTPEDMRDILGIEHRLHVKKILTMRERLKPLTAEEIRQRNELQREEHASQLRSMGAGRSSTLRLGETKQDVVGGEPPPTLTTLFMHVRNGRKNKVEAGLGRGFDVNTEDGHGNTLLITAAQQVNIPMCEMLLARGANVNHQNLQGNTALHYAMAYDPTGDVGEFLISKGADDTTENQWGLSPYDGITEDD
jgi:pimeloyl-ACP methyl ester carboxylesterase